MKVLASPGLECPMENDRTKKIPDSGTGVEVPDDSPYYQRLILDGSLIQVKVKAEVKSKPKP